MSATPSGVRSKESAGSPALRLFERHGGTAAGRWLVSKLICFKAPYFASIKPTLELLAPGRAIASIRHRRSVQNHVGTVHAIALCNLAEFCGGLATDAAMTRTIRWIPKGMTVRYLRKATGSMRGEAILDAIGDIGTGAERIARVSVRDPGGEVVFEAEISMWVSPKKG